MRELKRALKKANKKSARGHDGITTRLITDACQNDDVAETLRIAINESIIEGHDFPEELKDAKIIPLPKAKKNEYRPIMSLLTSLSKLIEISIIEHRTRNATCHLFAKNQFGGRPAHNSTQALNRFIHAAGMAAHSRQHFGAI